MIMIILTFIWTYIHMHTHTYCKKCICVYACIYVIKLMSNMYVIKQQRKTH